MLPQFLVKHRLWCSLAFLAFGLSALIGLRNLEFEMHYQLFIDSESRFLEELNAVDNVYQAREDGMLFIVEAPEGEDLYQPEGLALIQSLTRKSLTMSDSFDVESLANFQVLEIAEDELFSRDFLPDPDTLDGAALAALRAQALGNDAIARRLISEDGKVAAVLVTFALSGDRMSSLLRLKEQAEVIRADAEGQFPGHQVYLGGLLMLDFAMIEAAKQDALLLIPLVLIFVYFALWLVFRSAVCSALTIIPVGVNLILTLAVAGLFGYSINVLTFSAMIAIATLSVADSIHLISSFLSNIRQGHEKVEAMMIAMDLNFRPMLLTSVSTAIGFLALSASPSPPVASMGLFAALGMVIDFLTTIFLLPFLILLFSGYRGLSQSASRYADTVANLAVLHPRRWVLGGLAACFFVGAFAFDNDVNDDALEWFDESLDFRQSVIASDGRLQGFKTITFNLDSKEEGGTLTPAFMGLLDEFVQWLDAQPEIQHVHSYLSLIKESRQAANEDDPAFNALPQSREEAAQLLLLREFSMPSSRSINTLLSIDKRETRVLLSVHNIANKEYLAFEERAHAWLEERAPAITRGGTSIPLMFAQINQDNLMAMVQATVVTMLAISVCLMIAFRSVWYGLLALLPNSLPLLVVFGIWGILFGTLDMAAVTSFSVALGIVVDDTIHIMSKYQKQRSQGQGVEDAIRFCIRKSAVALSITTVVLGGCFLMQSMSHFQLNATQGILVAMAIFFALIFDLFLLPALLLLTDKWREARISARATALVLPLALAFGALSLSPQAAFADAASKAKGLQIVEAADQKHSGYRTMVSDGLMTLFDGSGRKTTREFSAATQEGTRGADMTKMDFSHPKDVAGTALLTVGRTKGSDRQWVYLPSIKKVRRLSGGSSKNSFLGSEFTYEDLTSASIDKYSYDYLGNQACPAGHGTCQLVERKAKKGSNSAYARSILWINTSKFLTVQVQHFVSNGQNSKTFLVSKFTLVDGRFWRVAKSRMVNNISGRRTDMNWRGHKAGVSLPSSTFDARQIGQ